MDVYGALYGILDMFIMFWNTLDLIIVIPGSNVTFASCIVAFVIIALVGSILVRSLGSGVGLGLFTGIISHGFRASGKGGSKSDV